MGVGSAGREGMTLLDQSFCNLFDGRPSASQPISRRFQAEKCSYRSAAVKLTNNAGLRCARSIQGFRGHIVSGPIRTGDAVNIGHILSSSQRGLHSCLARVSSAVGGPAPSKPISREYTSNVLNNVSNGQQTKGLAQYIVRVSP